MISGFSLWYYRHQIYIDAEIKWKGKTFIELLNEDEQISKSNLAKTNEVIIDHEKPIN